MSGIVRRRSSVSRVSMLATSLDRAVRATVALKAQDAVCLGVDTQQAEIGKAALFDDVQPYNSMATLTEVADAARQFMAFDPISYQQLRRFLTRRGEEAVCAFLEDICTYHDVKAPGSRLKWARAVVASVETESARSTILSSMTRSGSGLELGNGTSGSGLYSTDDETLRSPLPSDNVSGTIIVSPARTAGSMTEEGFLAKPTIVDGSSPVRNSRSFAESQQQFGLSPLRESSNVVPMGSDSGGSGSFARRPRAKRSVAAVYKLVCQEIECATTTTHHDMKTNKMKLLPDDLFDSLYSWVARQICTTVLPAFFASADFSLLIKINKGLAAYYSSAAPTTRWFFPQGRTVASQLGLLEAAANVRLNQSMFERLGCIGTGSYGEVHVWRHRLTGTCYAVKSMDKKVLKHKASIHTVVRELACTLAVDSPYVCGFEFSFSDERCIHMGMRMMWRGDLERWLLAQPTRRFDENKARFYAAQMAIALKHLHQAGVVHRDIKGSNVLIDDQGHIRLTDFGLAVLMHSCGQTAPAPERICKGERSRVIDHCCLGCLQVSKLRELQKAAAQVNKSVRGAASAGIAACELVAKNNSTMFEEMRCGSQMYATSATTNGERQSAYVTGTEVSLIMGSPPSSPPKGSPMGLSIRTPAAPPKRVREGSYGLATPGGGLGLPTPFVNGDSDKGARTPPVVPPDALGLDDYRPEKDPARQSPIRSPATVATSTSCLSLLCRSSKQSQDRENTSGEEETRRSRSTVGFGSGIGPVPTSSNFYARAGTLSNYVSPETLATLEEDEDADDDEPLGGATGPDDFICAPAPPKGPLERFDVHNIVHPTVIMDCRCEYPHDDGCGWYKGRAGTSAYWPPQMISRDSKGDRVAYGAEADWWSYGCLVYCLMTGRSPFASGAGTMADNALTLSGRINWPRGIFSREAKDFISQLLSVDPARRLGAGPHGWKDVMSHPWFAKVDWALLEAKVLPAPCIPAYRMATNLTTPPEKIAGQYTSPAAAEAAAAEAAIVSAAAKLELTAEDEAIFEAVTYTAPDMLVRSVIKSIYSNDGPAVADPDDVVNVSVVVDDASLPLKSALSPPPKSSRVEPPGGAPVTSRTGSPITDRLSGQQKTPKVFDAPQKFILPSQPTPCSD